MSNFVKFIDSVNLKPLTVPKKVRDLYSNSTSSNTRPLIVKIAATHAGKVTRNNGFYLPSKMKQGAVSFSAPYPKPVLVHHKEKVDPIGRILDAKYVDISSGFRDFVKDSNPKISQLEDFINGKMSRDADVCYVSDHFLQDAAINADPDYEGLGYIEITASISNPDSIQKILDGRYLTGSVGATTNSAICSVVECNKDWAKDGRCDHKPGKVYDGVKCVLIAGDLAYEEYSFVNRPADTHSRVIEINVNGIQDFVSIDNDDETIPCMTLILDTSVKDQDIVSITVKTGETNGHKHTCFLDEDGDGETCWTDQHTHIVIGFKVKDYVEDNELKHSHTLIKPFKNIKNNTEQIREECFIMTFKKAFELAQKEDRFKNIEGLEDHVAELVKNNKKITIEELLPLLDVKLFPKDKVESEDFSDLPDSAFCGPDRTFPAVNKDQYLALLDNLKDSDSEDKDQILTIAERKAKRMGWKTEKVEEKEEKLSEYLDIAYYDKFDNSEVQSLFEGSQTALKDRNLLSDTESIDREKQIQEIKDTHEEILKDLKQEQSQALEEARKLHKEKMTEIAKRLEVSRKETRYLHEDVDNLNHLVADSIETKRKLYLKYITDLKVLSGEKVELQDVEELLKDKNSEDLDKIVEDLNNSVDMEKITDTLYSGLTNNPKSEVEDPTLKIDEHRKNKDGQLIDDLKRKYRHGWMIINKEKGLTEADKWLDQVVKLENNTKELS